MPPQDALLQHLRQFASAPFLFVGAGLSRRYLNLEGWEGLLRRFADLAGKPYEYYSSTANGDYLQIATLIAADLHEKWWSGPEFEESRKLYTKYAQGDESALKIEVARYIADSLEALPDTGPLATELDVLGDAVVDGIITTNFDPLLEHVFSTFKVFVGQDELLFSDPQGIGEIYKIHGSHENPNSLVLTTRDFATFRDRNPYLAAKLLAVFVEHPVVFLGYSLSDPNVIEILRSIASILTNDRIEQLQNRLIFVRWREDADPHGKLTATSLVTDGFTIPVQTLDVPDFVGVFESLAGLQRRFPARVLRQLKEHVYELVRDNDPKGRLYVQDLEADTDLSDVDVVLGVGTIARLVTSYKGKSRKDLILDTVNDADDLDPKRVVDEVLSTIATNQHVPIYKYLRGAGLLTEDGELIDPDGVDPKIRQRVEKGSEPWKVLSSYKKRAAEAADEHETFKTLAANCDPDDVLLYLAAIPEENIKPSELRKFLLEHQDDQYEHPANNLNATQWVKGVCLYDWLKYRRAPVRKGKKKPAKAKGKSKSAE